MSKFSLLSIIIELASSKDAELPSFAGRAAHAWLLQQIQSRDPAQAERLHTPNAPRPYTISDLWGPGVKQERGTRYALPGLPIYLRITSFEPELTAFMITEILPSLPAFIDLGGVILKKERALVSPDRVADRKMRARVKATTYEKMIAAYSFRPAPPQRFHFRFLSPTVFKSAGSYALFPAPRLLFDGLIRRWNRFAPVAAHPDLLTFVDEHVVVSSYRLKTVNVALGGGKGVIPGFVGECTYSIRHNEAYWLNSIHLLAAFSLYAGVGKNTAMGLGQTRSKS